MAGVHHVVVTNTSPEPLILTILGTDQNQRRAVVVPPKTGAITVDCDFVPAYARFDINRDVGSTTESHQFTTPDLSSNGGQHVFKNTELNGVLTITKTTPSSDWSLAVTPSASHSNIGLWIAVGILAAIVIAGIIYVIYREKQKAAVLHKLAKIEAKIARRAARAEASIPTTEETAPI